MRADIQERETQTRNQVITVALFRAVDSVSVHSRYQCMLSVFLVLAIGVSSFSVYGADIIYMNPKFNCPSQQGLLEVDACPMIDQCTLENSYTLTGRLQLYCGSRADDRNLIQAMTGVGGLCGVLIVSFVASWSGKRNTLLVGAAMGCLHAYSLMVGGGIKSVALLAGSQFMAGASHIVLYSMSLLLLEKLGTQWMRLRMAFIIGFSNNGLLPGVFTWAWKEWHCLGWLVVFCYTTTLLIGFFLIKEDPIFLFNRERFDELETVIQQIAEFNHSTDDDIQQAKESIKQCIREHSSGSERVQGHDMASYCICGVIGGVVVLSLNEAVIDAVYLANGYQLEEFDLSPMISLIASSLGDLTSCLVMALAAGYLFSRYSSRVILVGSVCLLIVCSLLYLTNFPSSSHLAMAVSLFLFHWCIFSLDINVAQIYSSSFPKPIENVCVGICLCASSLGKLIGPFLIRISEDNHLNPFVVFIGLMVIAGLIPALALPKINN